jgi:hypothetical protein
LDEQNSFRKDSCQGIACWRANKLQNLITRVAQTFETDGTDLNSSYAERVIANRDQNPLWNISENLKVV